MIEHKDILGTKIIRLIGLYLLIALMRVAIHAQDLPTPPNNFRTFNAQNGLYANKVRQIVQDSLGLIWIASNEGLIRFDGYDFNTYEEQGARQPLLNTDIQCLYKDKSNDLWIGTGKGLLKYHHKSGIFKEIEFPNKFQYYITSITQDNLGVIWVGTNHGVFSIKSLRAIPMYERNNERDAFAFVISEHRNWLWILNHNHIYTVESASHQLVDSTRYTHEILYTDNIQTCISFDRKGNIWLGKYNGEVYCYSPSKRTIEKYDFKLITRNESAIINDIYTDEQGRLWFSVDESGVYFLSDKGFHAYISPGTTAGRLPSYKITTIFNDREKNTWFAMEKNGLVMSNRHLNLFKEISLKTISNTQIVSAVLIDHKSRIWVGTDGGGLFLFDPLGNLIKKFVYDKSHKSGISNDAILSLYQDSKRRIWVGTFRGGLNRYDEAMSTFKHYQHDPTKNNSISKNDVRKIAEDANGNLWLCIHGKGVSCFNPEKETFKNYPDLVSAWTYDLLIDREGTIWVTSNKGISKKTLNDTVFKHYLTDISFNALSDNHINCLFEDISGDIWLGTNHGLFKTDKACTKVSQTKDIPSLLNASILSIQQTSNGSLYLGSNRGLLHYIPQKNTCQHFGIKDGLPSEDFIINAKYLLAGHILYLGTNNGLCWFDTDQISKDNNIQFVPMISDIKVFDVSILPSSPYPLLNSEIPYIKTLSLEYDQNHLVFDLACPSYYYGTDYLQFQYKMEGLDKDWQNAGKSRKAVYPSLPPGSYILKVRVLKDDITPSKTITLEIKIKPPFWETWWFKSLVAISVIGSIITYYTIKTKNIKQINRALEEKVLERTYIISQKNNILEEQRSQLELSNDSKDKLFSIIAHDLRSPFAGILALSDLLFDNFDTYTDIQRKDIVLHLKKASKNAFQILENLLQWARTQTGRISFNPVWVDIHALLSHVKDVYSHTIKEKGVEVSIIMDQNLQAYVDRDMLECILRNLLNNAIKFTPKGGSVWLSARLEQEGFKLSIKDTGIGMTPEYADKIKNQTNNRSTMGTAGERGTGIGLLVSKEFIDIHMASWEIASEPHKGTEFIIYFPCETSLHLNVDDAQNANPKVDPKSDIPANITIDQKDLELVRHKTVLIVEDQLDLRKALVLHLQEIFEIHEANNGAEALTLAKEKMPDLVLSDVVMPEINGLELSKRLKQDLSTSHIPIVLLTSQKDELDVILGLQTGVDDYLIKPYHPQILLLKLVKILSNRERMQKKFRLDDQPVLDLIAENSLDKQFVQKLYQYIEDNIQDEDFGVESLSQLMGMHRSNLSKKITQLTGYSPIDLIKMQRMKTAAKLLLASGKNVSEIAYAVGFSDPKYFSKAFKAYFGVLPSEYAANSQSAS